ncbi:circadian clock protein PASD1 [Phoca vitulina]|uniref:circadian clock protein PASD1 n=1 Tax=Phoca vitulina TaxID=9720 RepID=UPI001395CA84|nr:circadian clock protein PASD1 [Phoca vitulina]
MRLIEKKRRGEVNPETSREQSNWIPSFQSYEDFKCKTLQSLDGFMIILSADGVIIFVAGNITCLLGHLPNDIVGKKLLSLLPDHEKNDVYRKIALKLPMSNLVGKHIDFCCHLKRGNVDYDGRPTYEYVKFILTVTDISNEPLLLFSSFFPSSSFAESCPAYLPLEDRFYLVGSISLLRAQTLRELFTVKKPEEEVLLIEDSDEEHASPECSSGMLDTMVKIGEWEKQQAVSGIIPRGPLKRIVTWGEDQADILTVEQYDPQESVPVTGLDSDTSSDSSTSSLESTPALPAASSPRSFDFEPEAEQVYGVDEVQQVDEMEEVDQMGQMDEMGNMEQGDEEEEATVISTITVYGTVLIFEDIVKPIEPPLSITSYIHKRERELMKKFKAQLEEKTLMLQADLRSQKDALELMQEQLQKMQGSSLQARGQFHMQPHVSHNLDRPESQSLEPVPKKQRTERMKGPLPRLREISLSCGSCSSHAFKFSEELEEPGDVSGQPLLQGEDPFLPQPVQQVQDQHVGQLLLPEQQPQKQPQPPDAAEGTRDPGTLMQTQPVAAPVQLVAGQQASGYYQDATLGDDEDDSQSFVSEEQQGVSMDPLPPVYSPDSDIVPSTSFPQSPINSDSSVVTLETPQDYIQLWQEPQDPQRHLYLQVNTWPSSEQNTLQDQATWPQARCYWKTKVERNLIVPSYTFYQRLVPASEASPEALQDPDEYSPGHIGYFMSAEQSSLDEDQQQRRFHTKP